MAYQSNKPLATDVFPQSQADIEGNFQAIKTVIDINHETFGSAKQGKHKFVTLPQQGSAPATASDEFALYTKTDGANPAMFLRKVSSGDEINLTTAALTTTGYTILPSGLILKWGTGTVGTNTTGSATFDSTVAFSTALVPMASLSGQSGMDKALFVQSFNTTSITVYNANGSGGTRTFYYYILGF